MEKVPVPAGRARRCLPFVFGVRQRLTHRADTRDMLLYSFGLVAFVRRLGGSNSVTVTTASHCTWSAASDRGWMTISSGASGTGNGAVTVNVTANPTDAVRTGTLTIAGQSVSVREDSAERCTIERSRRAVHPSIKMASPAVSR